ncbi:MAG: Flagellar hook-associated protein FliD [Candidatus Ozemobacter sibiricus]|jgi:flagellar hook-associated protein 2|uniref:Filament cap protein n=1 Tax=Candidatus Ozemobacter sibiricus TaxID=2268124 RepID=A0A367ZP51_9BACT|nr:MAG: Flagellar hook-associated protein FliD [Candidatus Ozemobacter sibiricus]
MVDKISRNWVGGLSSGMDTQGLIDKLMQVEKIPVERLERKRNTLSYQKSLLQEINLKLFELQNRATDLTFSRTFNSKKTTSTNDKILTAAATTSAKVGSYTLRIKQLATPTKVASSGRLAGPLEAGHRIQSAQPLGGASTTLGGLGITPGNLQITVFGGGSHTIDLSTLNSASTAADLVNAINAQINADADLKGKVQAGYDTRTNQVRLTLLDTSKSMTVSDSGGDIITRMFDASSAFTLSSTVPVRASNLVQMRSGLNATLGDLGIDPASKLILIRGGDSVSLDLAGLTAASTIGEAIQALNHQIDATGALVKGGVPTGNPAHRLVEFRYDASTGRLVLANTDTADHTGFTLTDDTASQPGSNFASRLFAGGGAAASTADFGLKLISESFPATVRSGTMTIDGVQISVDVQNDTLQTVLARITSSTNVNATYDAKSDTIRLTRKDGSSAPIGVGSPTDTSNFLTVTGLIGGSQAAAAEARSTANLGLTLAQAAGAALGTLSPPLAAGVTPGTLRVTVNGESTDITYGATDTLNGVLDKVRNIKGIEDAYYDASAQRVVIRTSAKGPGVTLKVEDMWGGNLASLMNMPVTSVTGAATGSTLESAYGLSNIKSSAMLSASGLAVPVTAGTFTINGVSFLIANPAAQSLDGIISMINNNAKVGVKARFDPAVGGLELTSTQPGNLSIALGAPSDTSNFLSALGLLGATQKVGQNAIFSIDEVAGGADQVRQSNQISDLIEGVTFTLKDVTGSAGETITITTDTEVARKGIDEFLKVYNETISLISTRLTEKRDFSLEGLSDDEKKALKKEDLEAYEARFKVGLLAGDSTLSMVRSRMRVVMAGVVKNVDKEFDSLSDLGISTGAIGSAYQETQSGVLKVLDEEKLNRALRENPDKVAELFARESTTESGRGIARRLKDVLNEFTKSDGILTRRVGRSGVANSNSEMDRQIRLINDQIIRQNNRLVNRENALIKQFSDLESAMSRYQTQSQAFANQLAQLTGGK